ncbi:hypothetical protein CIPAW_06G064500 [Carya illinoinensis]|uniref:Uncharacterized protein n=1 Tax=Carya illinoinensis TaxID=32201 RepID=A0A8T1Q8K3_CARIL|nr:hypothetical protein CIPAW_06G064500 [Carya illinoinensis]
MQGWCLAHAHPPPCMWFTSGIEEPPPLATEIAGGASGGWWWLHWLANTGVRCGDLQPLVELCPHCARCAQCADAMSVRWGLCHHDIPVPLWGWWPGCWLLSGEVLAKGRCCESFVAMQRCSPCELLMIVSMCEEASMG